MACVASATGSNSSQEETQDLAAGSHLWRNRLWYVAAGLGVVGGILQLRLTDFCDQLAKARQLYSCSSFHSQGRLKSASRGNIFIQ